MNAATVAGGTNNLASGAFSFVGGGSDNVASGNYCAAVGGHNSPVQLFIYAGDVQYSQREL